MQEDVYRAEQTQHHLSQQLEHTKMLAFREET